MKHFNMKNILFTLLIMTFSVLSWAQSEPLFTHYMFNRMNYNPAYVGSKEVLDAAAIYRNQWWSGIDGSPKTFNIFAHAPFAGYRNGLGVSLITDKIGLHKTLSVGINYAYRIKLKNDQTLALGLGVRNESSNADWTKADLVDVIDGLVPDTEERTNTFNAGAGIYFTHPNFYLGLSVPRLLKNSLYSDGDEFSGKVNTYYFMAGIITQISRNVKFYPNFMISLNPNVPFEFDVNANFLFFDSIWLGANYRFEDSLDGLVQYEFKNGLRAGFALDFTTSELKRVTTGSYEILIGYTFPCEDCKILNLRYF